jgi:anti-sigma factor RsiW
MAQLISRASSPTKLPESRSAGASTPGNTWRYASLGWAAAAAILILSVSILLVQRVAQQGKVVSAERAALVTEVSDQHIATLAANLPPQVLSTDRHTVKPWFQGKLPFSFNLPESLPRDTTLEGANLSYLHGNPVAQLLYSIGKHRVSVFVTQNAGATDAGEMKAEHSGFHVSAVSAGDLRIVAVSDVDPSRLADLIRVITRAQTGTRDSPQ